jgi:ABC-2 type transport system ATP-binding protein
MPATTSSLAVSAHGLSKSFGDTAAVSEVDLEISSGAVFGLLGPDGAGKSTLIRMLATVLTPDAGSASVFGKSVTDQRDAVTGRIGYMSQRFSMYPDLSVAENLEFFATVRGVSRRDRAERSQRLLASMGLAEFADRQAENLSGGMKQKLMLATTLMHDPELLLLDEPTTGVDPVSRREFWRILAGLHREGRTVLVATPYMDEAERCTDIAFLDNGRITRAGTPEQIKAQVPGRLVEVTSAQPRRALAIIEPLAGVGSAHLLGDVVRVLWSAPSDPGTELGAALRAGGLAEAKVSPADIDMETVFAFLAETAATDHEPVRS